MIVVDENYVPRIPNGMPLDKAAPLFCAGITLYSPLRHWKAGPGKKVAIVGLGGLGHMQATKIARALGADVTVAEHVRSQARVRATGRASPFRREAQERSIHRIREHLRPDRQHGVRRPRDGRHWLRLKIDGALVGGGHAGRAPHLPPGTA